MYKSWKLIASVGLASALLFGAAPLAMATDSLLVQPNPKLAVAGSVYAVLKQADGGTIIGGDFESVNGLPRHNLARRTADGQVDPDWQADVDGAVYALAADVSGAVYVGGRFSIFQGAPRSSVAKLSTTGILDPLWDPSISDGESIGGVNAIALDTVSGSIYLAGQFNDVGGVSRTNLAKLSTSGTGVLDASWNPSSGYSIDALAIAPDGSVYVGGQFDEAGGLPRHNIAKLSATTGAADPSWDANPNGTVIALVVDESGRLYVGGDFDQVGGQSRRGIARLVTAGAADPSWDKYLGNPTYVLAMDLSDSGELYVGGTFNPLGGLADSGNVVRFDVDGNLDSLWMPITNQRVRAISVSNAGLVAVGGDFTTVDNSLRLGFAEINASGTVTPATDAEFPGTVSAIAVQPNGGTILGGSFLKGGGLARSHLLRILPNGDVDPVWDPSPDNIVFSIAVDGNELVYVGGYFLRIGGEQRARLARIDGTGNGQADPAWGLAQGGVVSSISIDQSGDVYLGGSFLAIAGVQQHYLARAPGGGQIDVNWNPPRDTYVTGIANTEEGQLDVLYRRNGFPNATGELKRVSKLDGAVTRTWLLDREAYGITSDAGNLYVYGPFNQVEGVSSAHLARINPDGEVDPSWNLQFDGYASYMAIGSNNEIYLGGSMFINGAEHRLLKVSAADAQMDPGWNHSVVGGIVGCLSTNPEGVLLVGGTFNTVDDESRAGFAAIGFSDVIFANGFEPPVIP